MTSQAFDRVFRLWKAHVSHTQVLLRSPKRDGTQRNVDIRFVDVEYLELPTILRGVRLLPPEPSEIAGVEARMGKSVNPGFVHVLETNGRRHIVVAASMSVEENDFEAIDWPLEI